MQPSTTGPRVVLVTGASRGIGAAVAQQLGDPATHVLVNYREKTKRATGIVDAIRNAGGQASLAPAELSDESAVTAMFDELAVRFGRLDTLILNASGGLERGADPGYAMRINHDAQLRLARLALPLMPVGGRIVFVTSHQAHFYPSKAVPEDYVPIAKSKRAGEDALRDMRAQFDERGVKLVVVSGDMIDGTIIIRLLGRRDPSAVAARRAHGALPTVDEFASTIVSTALARDLLADTVYVGGPDYLASRPDKVVAW
jgi:3-oxoacyl-[acyl-carrier protein] reductase